MSAPTISDRPRAGALRRFASAFVGSPSYPPNVADLRTVTVLGIEMPFRAAVAVVIVTMAVLFDFSRTFIPESIQDLGRAAEAMRFQAIQRFVLFLVVPMATVVLLFRDSPSRYGLRIGDWRWGISLVVLGIVLMTPIVIALAGLPAFRSYYGPSVASVPDLVLTNSLDLFPAEFLIRGFLMFPLIRLYGGIGLLVATLPFTFSHLGKPEIETFSTLFGGLVYAWVDWRTGSILYSAIAHVYIVTLLVLLAAG
jgi:membrane protease YdiL (CAAX protease family)